MRGFAEGHGARFTVAQVHPRGPRIGFLKSPSRTSYLSSIEIIALNCNLVFEKTAFCVCVLGDTRTDKENDGIIA